MELFIIILASTIVPTVLLTLAALRRKGKKTKKVISIMLTAAIVAGTVCIAGCTAGTRGEGNASLSIFKQHAQYKDRTLTLDGYTPCEGGTSALGFEIPYLYYLLTQETGDITDWDKVEVTASEGSTAEEQQKTGSLLILIYRDAEKGRESVDMWLINLGSRQYVLMEHALKSPVPPAGGSTRLDKADVIKKVEALVRLAAKNKAE